MTSRGGDLREESPLDVLSRAATMVEKSEVRPADRASPTVLITTKGKNKTETIYFLHF